MSVEITEKAASEIKRVMSNEGKDNSYVLRVQANSGGCAGFSYGLSFIKKEDVDSLNDVSYEDHGIEWVVDNKSGPLLEGTKIDFHDGIDKRGFTFENPLATKGCGCGNSFSV